MLNIVYGQPLGVQQDFIRTEASQRASKLSNDLLMTKDMIYECFYEMLNMINPTDQQKDRLGKLERRFEYLIDSLEEKAESFEDVSKEMIKL